MCILKILRKAAGTCTRCGLRRCTASAWSIHWAIRSDRPTCSANTRQKFERQEPGCRRGRCHRQREPRLSGTEISQQHGGNPRAGRSVCRDPGPPSAKGRKPQEVVGAMMIVSRPSMPSVRRCSGRPYPPSPTNPMSPRLCGAPAAPLCQTRDSWPATADCVARDAATGNNPRADSLSRP